MMPKMDPKQMAKLMQQMGVRTEEIDAERVIIEKTAASGGGRLLIENPSVTLIDAKGQKSLQISGEIREEVASAAERSNEKEAGKTEKEEGDVDVVARQAGVSKAEAQEALTESGGDIAEAILALEEKRTR